MISAKDEMIEIGVCSSTENVPSLTRKSSTFQEKVKG